MRFSLWIIFGLSFLLSVTACSYQEGTKTVEVEEEFSLDIPHYFSKTDRLLEEAPFQYQNRFRIVYALALSNEKSEADNLQAYTDSLIAGFGEDLTDMKAEQLPVDTIDGKRAMLHELYGDLEETDMYYILGTIEGQDKYYQVCTWTKADRKTTWENDLKNIILSFKEL